MTSRDIIAEGTSMPGSAPGRRRVAVIGIDRYRSWPVLNNAVRDARGALQLFERLGFEPVGEPLFDDAATGAAIHSFVTDELMALEPDDSLVLFFAGHGGTRSHRLGGEQVKAGYLIPVDAACGGDRVATWIDLDDWLRRIARLPPRHILVFLDACFAGIALSPIAKWRDSGRLLEMPVAALHGRRSRRIITSALDDQVALDSGPVPGHSLFTGCLIEGFTQGRLGQAHGLATGTEVGLYLQQRVGSYPGSCQTPDFGTFERDDRGEMVIPLLVAPGGAETRAERSPRTVSLAIATLPGPLGGLVGARSRWRRIAAGVVLASIGLVSTLATQPSGGPRQQTQSRDAQPHGTPLQGTPLPLLGTPQPLHDPQPQHTRRQDARPQDTQSQDTQSQDTPSRATPSRATPSRATPSRATPSQATSSPNTQPRGIDVKSPGADAAGALVTTVPPAGTSAPTAARPRVRSPEELAKKRLPVAIAPAVVTEEPVNTKPRVRTPPSRALKPAVDEHNCPVKGSHRVEVASIPPGATLYINHKECGAIGKTPQLLKLRPSEATATGTFLAILERPGEAPVMQEFEVLKIRNIQRVIVRIPPKRP